MFSVYFQRLRFLRVKLESWYYTLIYGHTSPPVLISVWSLAQFFPQFKCDSFIFSFCIYFLIFRQMNVRFKVYSELYTVQFICCIEIMLISRTTRKHHYRFMRKSTRESFQVIDKRDPLWVCEMVTMPAKWWQCLRNGGNAWSSFSFAPFSVFSILVISEFRFFASGY